MQGAVLRREGAGRLGSGFEGSGFRVESLGLTSIAMAWLGNASRVMSAASNGVMLNGEDLTGRSTTCFGVEG